jgi:hypothetical protein
MLQEASRSIKSLTSLHTIMSMASPLITNWGSEFLSFEHLLLPCHAVAPQVSRLGVADVGSFPVRKLN